MTAKKSDADHEPIRSLAGPAMHDHEPISSLAGPLEKSTTSAQGGPQ